MTLGELRDFFKTQFGWTHGISIGKIDKDTDRAVCFYGARVPRAKESCIGGKRNKSYDVFSVTVLLRFGHNAAEAQEKAREIYDFFDEKQFLLNGKRVFVISVYDAPLELGTDEDGVYEYSFNFDFYENKTRS